ncbi:metal-dependent hydrolase (plasmid) [Alkalihalophilus sp. As8PL]|uniref:Metal-dependent hydrolase n=1 Tax=Alkalihalophilus sp. As8PL TaxID=3237103 RepID=A0AB39BMA9_9BACI
MLAVTHQIFGLTWGLLAILLINFIGLTPWMQSTIFELNYLLFLFFVLIGSIFLDIDEPGSKIGRMIPVIPHLFKLLFGHRTISHTLLFIVVLTGVCYGGLNTLGVADSLLYSIGLGIGMLSHAIGDSMTPHGVPLLWPFIPQKIRTPITFRTGSYKERLVASVLALVNVGLILYLV